jgi:pimeloyl-ACP methyl ester carboxylesterase
VRDYVIDRLAGDALAVLDVAAREASRPRAHLVGHDWGGGVAWWVALAHPERLASLAVLNCPHPLVFRRALATNPRQMARSWYMLLFQLPWLPEALFGARRGALLARGLRDSGRRASAGRPATFEADDLERYRALWSRPALRSMIHWYRALRRAPRSPPGAPDGRVRVPTRLIWGVRDRALGRELALPSASLCEDGELVFCEEATHWVQHEEAERVNGLLVAWVREHGKLG